MKKMMTMKDAETLAGVIIFFVCLVGIFNVAGLLVQKGGLDSAGFMPLIFLASAAFLSLLLVIPRWLQKGRPIRLGVWGQIRKNEKFWQVLLAIGSVAFYIYVLTPLVGFYVGSLLFLFGTITFYGTRTKIWKSIIIAGITVGTLYMIFTVMFKVPIR
jgi:hypothetical protein